MYIYKGVTLKKCSQCLRTKPSTEFWKQSRNKDGLFRMCKPCARKYEQQTRNVEDTKLRKAAHYQKHREKTLLAKKQYYLDNKAKLQDYKLKYYKKNFDTIAASAKKYREENQEKTKKYMKAYRQKEEFSLQARHYQHSRRARIKSSCDGTINKEFLQTLITKQNHACYYCGTPLVKGNTHLDHYVPISKGGAHSIGNVVFACCTCNLTKSAKVPTSPLVFSI